MKVVGKYDMLHGLVANPQPNPKCVKSGKQLEALYAKALPLAETLILEFMAKLDTDEPLDKAYDHTFGEFCVSRCRPAGKDAASCYDPLGENVFGALRRARQISAE